MYEDSLQTDFKELCLMCQKKLFTVTKNCKLNQLLLDIFHVSKKDIVESNSLINPLFFQ